MPLFGDMKAPNVDAAVPVGHGSHMMPRRRCAPGTSNP